MFDKMPSASNHVAPALLASMICHALLILNFWNTPRIGWSRFTEIQVVHAADEEVRRGAAGAVLRWYGRPHTSAFVPASIPVKAEPAAVGDDAVPVNAGSSFDIPAAPELSDTVLQTRIKDLGLIDVSPEELPPPPPPPPPIRIGGRLQPAHLVKQVTPAYPAVARTARVQGTVIVEASITETGAVEDIKVVEGHPMLIAAAVDAVRQWRYEPARLNGVATRVSARITVHFRLELPQ
jgi:TonB family protein